MSGGQYKHVGTPPAKPTTKKVLKQRQLQRERLEMYVFQSPPPFARRATGHKHKSSVFVNGKDHTLVHSCTLNKWRKNNFSSACVCCYERVPPPQSDRSKKRFMSDGSCIPQTCFTCDTCENVYVSIVTITYGDPVLEGVVYHMG